MAFSQGFWSYVHDDDQADGERISRLARDVIDQYKMLTGDDIQLFLDKDDIEWGDKWHDEIDSNLSSVAFFIPVMTPRYFMSPECRRELQFFARRSSELGLKELILPLLYVDVPALHEETIEDDLIELVRTFQWEDWRELRYFEIASEGYRRGVARLATRLVEANKRAEEKAVTRVPTEETHDENEDDSPGVIDLLANSEEMLLRLPETLKSITQYINQIGQIMQEATIDIQRGDEQGKGFAARLIVTRRTATRLSEPTDSILSLSNIFTSQLHDVDTGIRIMIDRAPSEIKDNPDAKKNFCTLFESIRNLSDASVGPIESLKTMIDKSEPLERISRDLRPILRRLKQGIMILIESTRIYKDWIQLIHASGIVCEDTTSQIQESAS